MSIGNGVLASSNIQDARDNVTCVICILLSVISTILLAANNLNEDVGNNV
jgi:hypothetical protein